MADSILPQNTAYVYAILVDGVVRYIGKGTGARTRYHLNYARRLIERRAAGEVIQESLFYNRLCGAILADLPIEIKHLSSGHSDEAAYAVERAMIATAPEGQLWNLREGGEGFTSKDAHRMWATRSREAQGIAVKAALSDPDVRRKISESIKAALTPSVLEARRASQKLAANRPETIAAKSVAGHRNWADPEYRSRVLIAQASPEVRLRMSTAAKSRPVPSDFLERMEAGARAKYGPSRRSEVLKRALADPSVIDRLSALSKARWADPEWRSRMLASRAAARLKKTRGE